jgi:hypothetical protein
MPSNHTSILPALDGWQFGLVRCKIAILNSQYIFLGVLLGTSFLALEGFLAQRSRFEMPGFGIMAQFLEL